MYFVGMIFLTIAAIQYGFVPPIVDLTETHVFHEEWPPHARFHMMWLLATGSMLAAYVIVSIWVKGENRIYRVKSVSIIGCIVLIGFFMSTFFKDYYGGALSDLVEPIIVLGIDGNVFSFSIALLLQFLGTWLVWCREPVNKKIHATSA